MDPRRGSGPRKGTDPRKGAGIRKGADPRRSSGSRKSGAGDPANEVVYSESLRTPFWWYLVGIVVAGVLAAEFHVGGVSLTDVLPYVILIPLAIGIVFAMGHNRLVVRDGELHIRGAHLPLSYVTGVVGLDARTMRLVVGREGDPAAFVQIRPWIGPGVQLWIDDEDDPTPYWVVSTRHPEKLIAAVNTVR